ncbi:MAG: hypothetical protein V7K47_26260 [Nostoc sp.]
MSKGGQTQGTWGSGSSWHSGPTKTIRVPIALEAQIMEYARAVDSGIGVSHVNTGDLLLKVIDSYVDYKRLNYHPHQNSKQLDTSTRAWDELRKFQKLLQENPAALGIADETCNKYSGEL